MSIEFDPDKDKTNREKHGLSLQRAENLDLDEALTREDKRFDYGERRWVAIGPIDGQLHVLVYTLVGRKGQERVRAISLRLATEKETQLWLS